MTFLIRKSLLTLTIITSVLVTAQLAAKASTKSTKFVCGNHNDVPTTIALTANGKIPVISWTSDYFAEDGYTPEVRCQQVSGRFERYYKDGSLKYLTTGLMNGKNVICTTDNVKGSCKNLLLTLKKGTDPSEALKDLLNVKNRARSSLTETGPRVYIDVEKLLSSPKATE